MFEIWNGDTANVVGEYRTIAKAFADVRATITRHGSDAVESWILLRDDGDDVEQISAGRDLIFNAMIDAMPRHALQVASIRLYVRFGGNPSHAIMSSDALPMLRACA